MHVTLTYLETIQRHVVDPWKNLRVLPSTDYLQCGGPEIKLCVAILNTQNMDVIIKTSWSTVENAMGSPVLRISHFVFS